MSTEAERFFTTREPAIISAITDIAKNIRFVVIAITITGMILKGIS